MNPPWTSLLTALERQRLHWRQPQWQAIQQRLEALRAPKGVLDPARNVGPSSIASAWVEAGLATGKISAGGFCGEKHGGKQEACVLSFRYQHRAVASLQKVLDSPVVTAAGANFLISRKYSPYAAADWNLSTGSLGSYSLPHDGFLIYADALGVARFLDSADGRRECKNNNLTIIDLANQGYGRVLEGAKGASGFDYIHVQGVHGSASTGLGLALHHVLLPIMSDAMLAGRWTIVNCKNGRSRSGGTIAAYLMEAGESREEAIRIAQAMRGMVDGKTPVSSSAAHAFIDQAEHLRTHPQKIPDNYVLIDWFSHAPGDILADIVTRA